MKRTPIRRTKPLQATKPAKGTATAPKHGKARKTPLRPKKRTSEEFARIYHSEERVQWVASLRCACGCNGTPCENAHTTNDGVGRKAGYETIIPLTPRCHRLQTDKGWGAIGLNRGEAMAIARDVQRLWERLNG